MSMDLVSYPILCAQLLFTRAKYYICINLDIGMTILLYLCSSQSERHFCSDSNLMTCCWSTLKPEAVNSLVFLAHVGEQTVCKLVELGIEILYF